MKIIISMILIGFWVMLPPVMILFDLSGYAVDNFSAESNEGIVTYLFKSYTFTLPDFNFWIGRMLNFLQILSLLVVYVLLKES